MQFQTVTTKEIQDTVFRSVVSGITGTSTVAPLTLGEPVVLATATIAQPLGHEVIRPVTGTTVGGINRLWLGPVVSPTIPHEGAGLVCAYGVAQVRLTEAATVAAFDVLSPNLNSTATALAPYGQGAWVAFTVTATDLRAFDSGARAIVVAPATAVSGTNSYTNGYAFIRAM